ncbi:MAG: C-GCAxxG-C-C family protein [Christensenellaceae bacterium]|nr:C-GCAxxG-C-C family protein [Christensenellaceae bacterium]
MSKEILIWGAGKIGRGFAADVYAQGGFHLTFWDNDKNAVAALKKQGSYTLYKLDEKGGKDKQVISGFDALAAGDPADEAAFEKLTLGIGLMALCVFPQAFPSVAEKLAQVVKNRAAAGVEGSLDVVIFANQPDSVDQIKKTMLEQFDEQQAAYFEEKVGLCQGIVVRMAVQPTAEMIAEDPLVVASNDYPTLFVDAAAFKGEKADCPNIQYVENFFAWEQRKIFTYNMLHALFAYTGVHKGYKTVYEATGDADIMALAENTLAEVSQALQLTYGFSDEEMRRWNDKTMANMKNPYLNDMLTRVGGDPIRKLRGGDRLAGAAILCKQNGKMPYYLTKVMAYGYLYDVAADEKSQQLQKKIKKQGLAATVKEVSGLKYEPEMVTLVCDRFDEILDDPAGGIADDEKRVALYKKAWQAGFDHEVNVKGCAQCTLLAVRDVLGVFDENVFKSATAFSAGMSLCGDSACGGYSGGLMAIGLEYFRDLDDLVTKNKVGQYTSFDLGAQLHDRFCQCYGGVRCTDVHEAIYGQSYVLRNSEEKAAFEAVGAHVDKCTTVVGMAIYMIVKILADKKAAEENA